MFLSGKDIVAYLKSLETEQTKVEEVDFAALKTDGSAKPVVKEKEDAKIEGAVQIAISFKKEVDFSAWYQNVSAAEQVWIRALSIDHGRFC